MREESHNPWTDLELEARIVALVLGEASDFERDELNRLLEERPELAAFKDQIQGLHGLLRDVATGESVAEDDAWKLSAEKRGKVLAEIGGETEGQPADHVVTRTPSEGQRPVGRGRSWNVIKLATAVCVAGLLAVLTIPAWFDGALDEPLSRFRQLGLAEHNYHAAHSTEGRGDPRLVLGDESTPRARAFRSGGTVSVTPEDNSLRTAESATAADLDYAEHSRSSLLDIQGTLDVDGFLPSPHYTQDDVGYFPTDPEFKLPPITATPRSAREEELRYRAPPAAAEGRVTGRMKFGAGVNADAGVTGSINVHEPGFAFERGENGDRPTSEQLAASKSDDGGLSFPNLETHAGDRNTSGPAVVTRATVRVPDEGTVLLGGIKRRFEGRADSGDLSEPTVSSRRATRDFGEPQSGDATQGVASGITTVRGLGDPGVPGGTSEIPGDVALEAFGSQGPGQEKYFSREQAPLRGGTALEFEVLDSPARGKDKESEGIVAYGIVSDGEISAGSGRTAQAQGPGKDDIAELESKDVASGELNAWRKTGELAGAEPSPSTMAGMGVGGKIVESQDSSGSGTFEAKGLDTNKWAISPPSPTTKLKFEGEDAKSKGNPTLAENSKEEFAKEFFDVPSEDDSAVQNLRGQDHDTLSSLQVPEVVTGTVVGQPVRPLGAGRSIHEGGWSYSKAKQPGPTTSRNGSHAIEMRVKDSLEQLSKLSELHDYAEGYESVLADDFVENGTRSSYRSQADLTVLQKESLRQHSWMADSGQNQWRGYVPPMSVDDSESMKTRGTKLAVAAGLQEKTAEDEALSTFSLHVSDVSFKLALAALALGEWPEAAKVRIEEFVNAFDYGDPLPSQSERVSCRLEQSIHPFLQQRNLVRISMRTSAAGRSPNTPLRLTFLLDNSGSMERIDRQQTVRRAFALLTQQLTPVDQVTLISFARQPRLLAENVGGVQAHQLVKLVANLPSEGGTNIEAALQLAFEKAQEQKVDGAQNRIILLTDGAVNLGDANPDSLSRMITTMRGAGIAFDAAGISAEGLNDAVLEALTRKGDGRYYLLDSLEAADDGFARQIAGALRPSAKNVKVQVEFNPQRVGRYKLLGFEKHRLKQEDFRNDTVDAAELTAEESGVAMYQFEAKPDGQGDVGSVSVRFRDVSTGQMIEKRWPIPYQADAPRPDQAAPSMRIATSAALLAAKLRGEPLGETVDLKTLSDLLAGLPDRDRMADRVQQLQRMILQARQVSGKE